MKKAAVTTLALIALAGIAGAQTTTTYTIPAGTVCTGPGANINHGALEGCYIHELTTTDDPTLPFAWFNGGGYWAQLDQQAFQDQNPAQTASYADGTGVWTSTTILDDNDNPTGQTGFTFDATAYDGNYQAVGTLHADIIATGSTYIYQCGRYHCTGTKWVISSGDVILSVGMNGQMRTANRPFIVGGPGDGH